MTSSQKKQLVSIFLLLVGIGLLSFLAPVFAQTAAADFGISQVDESLVLSGDEDIRVIIGKIIRAALGLLGIIVLGIVLYAGFLWMTSGGDDEKIGQSKKLLTNAVIGLAIILSSLAIVQFVLSKLSEATGGNFNPSENCRDASYATEHFEECRTRDNDRFNCTQNPVYCASRNAFVVKSVTPQTLDTKINDVKIRVLFSRPVATPIEQVVKITRGETDVTSEFDIYYLPGSDSTVVEAVVKRTASTCQTEGLVTCLKSDNYQVRVQADVILDRRGNRLETSVNGISFPTATSFKMDSALGTAIDQEDPTITAFGIDGKIGVQLALPRGATYPIHARIEDTIAQDKSGGVGYVRLTVQKKDDPSAKVLIAYEGPRERSDSPYDFSYPFVLSRNSTIRDVYIVTLEAYDIDHRMDTESFEVVVVGALCKNGRQDEGESGVDEGGECRLTNGCVRDSQCEGVCDIETGMCIEVPRIENVDPWNGAPGNWITIKGRDFGIKPGLVEFGVDTNNNGSVENNEFTERATLAACTRTSAWNDEYIVVSVPVIPADVEAKNPRPGKYSIRVTKADADPNRLNRFRDTTTDGNGLKPGPDEGLFTINSTRRPGLCSVETANGARAAAPGTNVTAYGTGFGDNARGVAGISFGGINGAVDTAGTVRSWSAIAIGSRVPANLEPQRVDVTVTLDGQKSNGVPFTVERENADLLKPVIESVDPVATTPGSLVTVYGKGFGDSGFVFLAPRAGLRCDNVEQEGCVPILPDPDVLPDACSHMWKDTQIIAHIPKTITPPELGTTYAIVVRNSAGVLATGDVKLLVARGEPLPSICAISHDNGPAPRPEDSPLVLTGVNFMPTAVKPTVYFWSRNAKPFDPSTWLKTVMHQSQSDTRIQTQIPVANGYSMITGPIKVRAEGEYSNSVRYTVQDCRDFRNNQIPRGMQCCRAGADAGSLKADNQLCAGETREAGYVWRFTTGKIPRVPHVLENECKEDGTWKNANTSVEFPSPTPWVQRTQGNNVCLNATVAVRFSMQMNEATVQSPQNVKVYTCDSRADGSADCAKKQAVAADQLTLTYQNDTLIIREERRVDDTITPNLIPDTWYRVELSDAIRSNELVTVLGQPSVLNEPLQKTRPCGDGTAYCFEFRTGNGVCQVSAVGMNPANHDTSLLGLVDRPLGSGNPLYYLLWGRSSQECTVVGVDNKGWVWRTTAPTIATVENEPGEGYTDSRAKATALQEGVTDIVASAEFSREVAKTVFTTVDQRVTETTRSVDILAATGVQGDLAVRTTQDVKTVAWSDDLDSIKNRTLTVQFSLDDLAIGDFTLQSDGLKQFRHRTIFYKDNGYSFRVTEYRDVATGHRTRDVMFSFRGFDHMYSARQTDMPMEDWKPVETYTVKMTDTDTRLYRDGVSVGYSEHTFVPVLGNVQPMYIGAAGNAVGNSNTVMKGTVRQISIDQVTEKIIKNTVSNTVIERVRDGFISATSTLEINLSTPGLLSRWPLCNQTCTNATIGMTFNRPMRSETFANGVKVRKCTDEFCTAYEGGPFTANDFTWVQADDRSYRLKPTQLDLNSWYEVSIDDSIVSIGQIRTDGTIIDGATTTPDRWQFKTKAEDGACVVEAVSVVPLTFTAKVFHEKTKYAAFPLSSPDVCSEKGQELDPWEYGWNWSTANPDVATVSTFTSTGQVQSFCSAQTCLPVGSMVARNDSAQGGQTVIMNVLCGNGRRDAGEDCDIGMAGEKVGTSCMANCLRPGSTAATCGNGTVETDKGEECDTNDAATKSYCTAQCTLKPGVANQGLCGDGKRNRQGSGPGSPYIEDCDFNDVNISERARCSQTCMHLGTELTAAWCATALGEDKTITAEACTTAKTVCGNNQIEKGEECEIGRNGATADTCDSRCLLKNVCDVPTLKQCLKGSEGCLDDCTWAGSSVVYSQPSLCGNSIVERGEYAACETTVVNDPTTPGQNPLQVVTAVGNASVNPDVKKQETKVNARVVTQRTATGSENVGPFTGSGDYALQCGYTEYVAPVISDNLISYNDCATPSGVSHRGLTHGVASNSCCYPRPERVAEYPRDGAGILGSDTALDSFVRDVDVFAALYEQQYTTVRDKVKTDIAGILVSQTFDPLKAIATQYIDPAADHASLVAQLNAAVDTFWTEREMLTQAIPFIGNEPVMNGLTSLEASYVHLSESASIVSNPNSLERIGDLVADIRTFIEQDGTTVVPHAFSGAAVEFFTNSYHFLVAKDTAVEDPSMNNLQEMQMRLANLSRSIATLQGAQNDYVNAGSALPAAAIKTAVGSFRDQYSILFNNDAVCRNTYIAVTFNDQISEESLQNNLMIAKGQIGGACAGQTVDVTDELHTTLALNSEPSVGRLKRVWQGVVNFFYRIFGKEAYASEFNPGNTYVWCSGTVAAISDVVYETVNNKTVTRVTLALNDLLDANSYYAVMLRGGKSGIRTIRGVGIRNPDSNELSDSWVFQTGNQICKLESVTINPSEALFTAPNTSAAFIAYANGENNSGLITPIKNQYDWVWSWGPRNHPVFAIPATEAPTNTANTLISSKTLEGEATAVANARIVFDKDLTPSTGTHLGIFTGTTALTADFCEHPWPERETYPYKDDTYHFSMRYCADAGVAGNTDDDLPYLRQQLIPISDTDRTDSRGRELWKALLVDADDRYDDAIGMRILENPGRQTAQQWYRVRFPQAQAPRSATVAGYDAVIDGNTYYINFLRFQGVEVTNYILVLTLNAGAQAPMKNVFDQLLGSLKFNINMTDFGYCLNTTGRIHGSPGDMSDTPCTTDFNCRVATGEPKAGLSGVCSNVKTKFLRDWGRLQSIGATQNKLSTYYDTHNNTYPSFDSGSFIPNYTASYWDTSWGALTQAIGGFPKDPVNLKTSCADPKAEQKTCWNAENSTYSCPAFSSVYEYSYDSDTKDYMIHGPLEYFLPNDQIVTDAIDESHFSTSPWCVPGSPPHSPFAARCGDGVINRNEECEGAMVNVMGQCSVGGREGATQSRCDAATCQWQSASCVTTGTCGDGVIQGGEICDNGGLNSDEYGHCNKSCSGFSGGSCGNRQKDPGEFCDWNDTATNTPRYSKNKANSCALNCQGFGGYCGDGIKQPEELCEVGNVNPSTDLCFKRGDRWREDAPAGTPQVAFKYTTNDGYGYSESNTTFWYTFPLDRGSYELSIEAFNWPGDDFSGELIVNDGACRTIPGVQLHFDVTMFDTSNPNDKGKKIGSTCIPAMASTSMRVGKVNTGLVNPGTYRFAITWDNDWGRDLTIPADGANLEEIVAKSMGRGSVALPNGTRVESISANGDVAIAPNGTRYVGIVKLPDGSRVTNLGVLPLGTVSSTVNTSRAGDGVADIDTDAAINKVSLNATRQYLCRSSGVRACTYLERSSASTNEWGRADNPAQLDTYRCVPDKVAVAPSGAYCGDGIKQDNEACDLGDGQNGKPCTPEYGKICTYCSAPTLTPDGTRVEKTGCQFVRAEPVAYCGNGTIDLIDPATGKMEACDIERVNNTTQVVASTPGATPAFSKPQCGNPGSGGDTGTYACNATCTQLINQCVACTTNPNKGSIPKVAVLNVLTPDSTDVNAVFWGADTRKGLYTGQGILGASNWALGYRDYTAQQWVFLGGQVPDNSPYTNTTAPSDPLYTNGFKGLESNPLCKDKYKLYFNQGQVQDTLLDSNLGTFANPTKGSFFDYPVNGEGRTVENELVITPVPRPKEFRVVVRWKNNEKNILLSGMVYNEESYGGLGKDASVSMRYDLTAAKAGSTICSRMALSGSNSTQANQRYWLPIGCGQGLFTIAGQLDSMLQYADGTSYDHLFYAHDIGVLDKTSAQAMTISPALPWTINPDYGALKPYAFVVEGLTNVMGQYKNEEIFVDVYSGDEYPGAVPRYSIYKPIKTFSFKLGAETSSNPGARYWHVFNLVPSGNTFRISTDVTGTNGTLETDWDGVLENYRRLRW